MEKTFELELTNLLNRYSKETDSNTPNFILAEYLNNCLNAYNMAVKKNLDIDNNKIIKSNNNLTPIYDKYFNLPNKKIIASNNLIDWLKDIEQLIIFVEQEHLKIKNVQLLPSNFSIFQKIEYFMFGEFKNNSIAENYNLTNKKIIDNPLYQYHKFCEEIIKISLPTINYEYSFEQNVEIAIRLALTNL